MRLPQVHPLPHPAVGRRHVSESVPETLSIKESFWREVSKHAPNSPPAVQPAPARRLRCVACSSCNLLVVVCAFHSSRHCYEVRRRRAQWACGYRPAQREKRNHPGCRWSNHVGIACSAGRQSRLRVALVSAAVPISFDVRYFDRWPHYYTSSSCGIPTRPYRSLRVPLERCSG